MEIKKERFSKGTWTTVERSFAKTENNANKGYSWVARLIQMKELREIFKYMGVTKKPKKLSE